MQIKRPLAAVATTVFIAASVVPAVQADEVIEQIELGLELYRDGELGAAITELEFAINDIRTMMAGQLAETFPAAPDGWTAGETTKSGGGGMLAAVAGTSLEKSYQQVGGDGQIEAKLILDSPMIQGLAAMFANPAIAAAQPNTERVRIGRESALVKWEPERNSGEATLLLDGRIMLQVSGNRLQGPELLVELLKSWDLAEVRNLSAR